MVLVRYELWVNVPVAISLRRQTRIFKKELKTKTKASHLTILQLNSVLCLETRASVLNFRFLAVRCIELQSLFSNYITYLMTFSRFKSWRIRNSAYVNACLFSKD